MATEAEWQEIWRRLTQVESKVEGYKKMIEVRLTDLEKLQKQDADEAVGVCEDLTSRVEEVESTVEQIDTLVEYHGMLFTKYQVADLLLGRGSASSSSAE